MSENHQDEPSSAEEQPKMYVDNIVRFDGPHDHLNPHNMSRARKWFIALLYDSFTFMVTFSSAVFSSAVHATAQEFGVSTAVTNLGTALMVIGFAIGPIVFGPLSELYGRKIPMLSGMLVFCIFNIPVAVAQNLQTIMISRFIVGFGGSASLAIVGGALRDLFEHTERGLAVTIFGFATFTGPMLAPIVGGFVTMSSLGWRWTQWLTLIVTMIPWTFGLFFLPETYPPVLLRRKAARLRHETKRWELHSESEEKQLDIRQIGHDYLLRPVLMLGKEPILVLVTLYMSFVYGVQYLFFEAYPVSFSEERGWNLGVGALPFLAVAIGIFLGAVVIVVHNQTRMGRDSSPEERLVPMMMGAAVLPIGLFWFAWTSSPSITWVPEVLAGIPIGMGLILVFLQGLNYIIDVYAQNTNSAVAANVLVRSWFGGGFVLFADAMYHHLGTAWATTTLALVCVAMAPIPFLFYRYGGRIRDMSKFVPKDKG